MKYYHGIRLEPSTAGECLVEVLVDTPTSLTPIDNYVLEPDASLKLRNHSPTGFNWGYAGSGPAQLALAILLDYFGNPDMALAHYQRFKETHIATLPVDEEWEINSQDIDRFVGASELSQ